jgi:hypothetical protein
MDKRSPTPAALLGATVALGYASFVSALLAHLI